MRAFCFFVAVFFGASLKLDAAVINVNAAGKGRIDSLGGSIGNNSDGNYFAGAFEGDSYRNHFDFAIPSFTGTLDSATLVLRNDFDATSHVGLTHTYSLYGLGAHGSYTFSDIGLGTSYGSVTISSVGIVSVILNASAIAAISAAQGGTFSLGGVHSGENLDGNNYDFGLSGGDATSTTLILNTSNTSSAATPEPTTLAIFGIGAGIAGLKARRRKCTV